MDEFVGARGERDAGAGDGAAAGDGARIGTSLRRRGARRRTGAAVVALVGGLALAGCASQDPRVPAPREQEEAVRVGADGSDAQQTVLAEVYVGALERRGRNADAVTDVPADERVSAVRTGAVTLSFGCTGELLGLLDPVTAAQLAEEYVADDDPGKALSPEWRDRVYGAMSAAMPGEVMATDPSNAQGCGMEDGRDDAEVAALEAAVDEDPGAVLPQHIVPFYLKPALTRGERTDVLNRVAGSMSSDELDEITDDVLDGGDPQAVASEWLDTSRFTTG
ncbi:hypothetical protein [uncultured Corynebacterium sp.]|uniref:hypothetical protein n=1 Tax=uncultured Corynebacterium sp. TaxID=159447 RepID=UPI0025FCCAD1|nr:hypothetical protein [uncultured Corynebacterium sp.]